MSDTTLDKKLIVEDVVNALTGETPVGDSQADLRVQMERAAEEFDKRTASAFGKALLDSLTEDPGNLRQLEALLILGLAHPDVLRKNRISLAVEGRRLAILLERGGEVERARGVLELLASRLPEERTIDHELAGILRRSGNTDELVERYLARAQTCVAEGKNQEAIPWLQEILLLDRTRRDVARMIRDLRYQDAERQTRGRRRNRVLMIVLIISAAVTAVMARELDVRRKYSEIPSAASNDVPALEQRALAIAAFVGKHRVWSGMFDAVSERKELEERVADLQRDYKKDEHSRLMERQRLLEMASSARERGLLNVERQEFEEALANFRRSLSLSEPTWEHRERLEADIAALEAWQKENQ